MKKSFLLLFSFTFCLLLLPKMAFCGGDYFKFKVDSVRIDGYNASVFLTLVDDPFRNEKILREKVVINVDYPYWGYKLNFITSQKWLISPVEIKDEYNLLKKSVGEEIYVSILGNSLKEYKTRDHLANWTTHQIYQERKTNGINHYRLQFR